MNITAEKIQQSCAGSRVIEQQMKSILKTFQSEIIEAGKDGSTRVIVAVPTNFDVVNMNNKSAQTIVYHRLIKELENRGFYVQIHMDESTVTYCIRWDIQNNNEDMDAMRNVIASHMVYTTTGGNKTINSKPQRKKK